MRLYRTAHTRKWRRAGEMGHRGSHAAAGSFSLPTHDYYSVPDVHFLFIQDYSQIIVYRKKLSLLYDVIQQTTCDALM